MCQEADHLTKPHTNTLDVLESTDIFQDNVRKRKQKLKWGTEVYLIWIIQCTKTLKHTSGRESLAREMQDSTKWRAPLHLEKLKLHRQRFTFMFIVLTDYWIFPFNVAKSDIWRDSSWAQKVGCIGQNETQLKKKTTCQYFH